MLILEKKFCKIDFMANYKSILIFTSCYNLQDLFITNDLEYIKRTININIYNCYIFFFILNLILLKILEYTVWSMFKFWCKCKKIFFKIEINLNYIWTY
jgi:hypothetical protein